MKRKLTQLLMLLAFISFAKAQDLGRVIIRNGNTAYPKFIVSLNGVRLSNAYNATVCFDYLDERNYKVKLLQAGSSNVLTFMVNNAPNYVSKYILNKDNYGNYSLILESKALLSSSEEPVMEPVDPAVPVILPMSNAEYNDMIKAVRKESMESTKLEMAKTFFGNQNLSSEQVQGIVKLFSFENTKVDFAKFAYSRTMDKANYYKVYDAFTFSGSKKEMSEFIKNNP